MSFFKKSKQEAPEASSGNPYLNGREEWLERYGSYISRAAQWRMVAFFCLILTGISLTGNVMQANQIKTVPYIIEVENWANPMWWRGRTGPVPRRDA